MGYYIYAQEAQGGTNFENFVAFDLLEGETHGDSSVVTMHNVEEGSPITDHVRPDPSTLSLVLGVTNTPLDVDPDLGRGAPELLTLYTPKHKPAFDGSPGALFREAAGVFGGEQPDTTNIEVFGFTPAFDRIEETENKLIYIRDARLLVTVVTLSREYTDMVIVRFELTRTKPGSASFAIDLQQIRFVRTASVQAPQPKEPRGAPNSKKGQQSPKSPSDAAQLQKSDLLGLIQKFTGGGA